uniref:Uncharacterized protein n=1 Tax=Lepeophtheirus salmonis TaxID=72036 RepID=A0A0K2V466_LEPSM
MIEKRSIVNIVVDHTYVLPSTMDSLGHVTKRAKNNFMILSEKNELPSTHLKTLKIKN